MPRNESFRNPYRWVDVSQKSIRHAMPGYRHCFQGVSGRLWCQLEALTPLFVGSGTSDTGTKDFIKSPQGEPYIPATSLKGAIRALAELVGNAAIPFARSAEVDSGHALRKARNNKGQLDIVARTFGYLDGINGFAGLIHFSDGILQDAESQPHEWQRYTVAVGQPKPDHTAFYKGGKAKRKFYHHHFGARGLVKAPSNIRKTATLRPAPPGTQFAFNVDFENLRESELGLLLYCLVLEERATVTLGRKALGSGEGDPKTFAGPLRHKIGGAKPHGAGSVCIRIEKISLCRDIASRYRGQNANRAEWEGTALDGKLAEYTKAYRDCQGKTMQQLRAMMIYSADDPRRNIQYPDYQWFKNSKNSNTELKPTL